MILLCIIITALVFVLLNYLTGLGVAIGSTIAIYLILGIVLLVRTQKVMITTESDEKYRYPAPNKALTDKVTKKLSNAIKIPTISGDSQAICEFKSFLSKEFPLTFLQMDSIDVGQSLLLKFKVNSPSRQPAVFCGHMDVVPAGEGWEHGAFSGHIDKKYVWGRGALDCKATIIAILSAMENLLENKFTPNREIYFAFGHDEEIGGEEGAKIIAEYFEKQGIKPEFIFDEGGHITKKFANNENLACAMINVAEKGILTLELFAEGEGGHAAYPPHNTPIARLSEAVCRIEALETRFKLIPLVEEYFKRISGTFDLTTRMMYANQEIFKKSMLKRLSKDKTTASITATTFAPTMSKAADASNVIPDYASVTYNIRVIPSVDPQDIINLVENTVRSLGVGVKVIYNSPPSKISNYTSNIFVELERSVKTRFGESVIVTPGLMSGASDAKHYEGICDTVLRFTPLVLKEELYKTMHTKNERAPIESLGACTEFFIEFIEKIAR